MVDIKRVIEATEGRLPVLNGRGGLELTDNYRAGCVGMILAPDTIDKQVAIWRAMRAGHKAEAEALYEKALPTILFIMQSVESLICYGKRILRRPRRPHDPRPRPALRPTPMGLDLVAAHAARMGPFAA